MRAVVDRHGPFFGGRVVRAAVLRWPGPNRTRRPRSGDALIRTRGLELDDRRRRHAFHGLASRARLFGEPLDRIQRSDDLIRARPGRSRATATAYAMAQLDRA